MIVCAHGDVFEYCKHRGMIIVETWEGDFREYNGKCPVIVTDADISETEYYFEKGKLLARRIDLISTRYTDDEKLVSYISYSTERSGGRKGRKAFGSCPKEKAVVEKILELRKSGMTIRAIRETSGICHADGRRLSVSMIHSILKRRDD